MQKTNENQKEVNNKHLAKLDDLDQRDKNLVEVVATKCTIKEAEEIWKNFERYAVYDDLKDLYHRCVPAIAAVEDKFQLVKDDLKRM